MAKNKSRTSTIQNQDQVPAVSPQDEASAEETDAGEQTLKLPELLEPPTAFYGARHVELRLNGEQSTKLKWLMYSLLHQGVEIQRAPDAIRWLLDQIELPQDVQLEQSA